MKKKPLLIILALPILVILLTGCAEGLTPASWSGITVEGDVAYVAAGPQVYAVELENGRELWRFPQKGSAAKTYYAAPVLTPTGQLILGGYDKVLYSLDPDTGLASSPSVGNWPFTGAKDRWVGSVLVANELIYAPNADHHLYILNFEGELQGKPFLADNALWSTPVTDGKNIYFTSLGSTVYALDAVSGDKAWEQKIDGAIIGGIALGQDGVLYIGTFSGNVVALDSDGNTLWQTDLPGQIWSTPAVTDGSLYISTASGSIHILNAKDGRQVEEIPADSAVLDTPLVLENQIVFGTELGKLYFMDRESYQTNRDPLQLVGKLYGTAIPAGARILIAPVNGDNILLAFDFDGKQDWAFTPAK